jgi:hypothetical protein
MEMRHDDRLHTVQIPQLRVPRCGNCGELVFSNDACDQIYAAFRAQLHLLTPEQIRTHRRTLGLTEKELADRLKVSEELVVGWEEGRRIQSGAIDCLLRGYFGVPQLRAFLAGMQHNPDSNTCAVS